MAGSWDKPPRIKVQINKAMVAQILSANTPVGWHEHDDKSVAYGAKSQSGNRSRRTINGKVTGGWPRKSGRLRAFIGHIPNWHMKQGGKACYINIFLPYVRAINWGADIPAVAFDKWRMHWADGSSVFRYARRGYKIEGQHFLEKGVKQWAAKAGGLEVSWAKGTNTA
jgi:hypothetical protein